MKRFVTIVIVGLAVFAFRLMMGMSKFFFPDALQVYLIGLKSYTEKTFPYFGPDVVYTKTQIPGALQGLLVAGPLHIWAVPEAPYILLNLLSLGALLFFAWYLSKRFTRIPKWFTYAWLYTCPWALHYSVHIENPSYVLFGAVLFFIAVFELSKFYKDFLLSKDLLFTFLGFGVFWIMQLHLSWVMTLPFLAWIFWKNKSDFNLLLRGSLFFLIGAAISASTLIPTLLYFDLGDVESNVVFNPKNILKIPTTVFRFLSFASYEMGRFLGSSTPVRLQFVYNRWWTAPAVLFLLIIGFAQVAFYLISFFRKNQRQEWNYVKWFTAATLLVLSISFLFSVIDPRAHMFYLLFPVAFWYSFYCYEEIFHLPIIRKLAIFMLLSGIIFQIGLFHKRYDERSLFSHRSLVKQAIDQRDYTLVGLRRETVKSLANNNVVWKKNSVNDGFEVSTDFEPIDRYFKPQCILFREPDQNYVLKVDTLLKYSIAYTDTLSRLTNPTKVDLDFLYQSSAPQNFSVACEIKFGDETKKQYRSIQGKPSHEGEWKNNAISFDLPEMMDEYATISIYFWNKEKCAETLFVDELTLRFTHSK